MARSKKTLAELSKSKQDDFIGVRGKTESGTGVPPVNQSGTAVPAMNPHGQDAHATLTGPQKGDFIPPPDIEEEIPGQDAQATLPDQEEFWRPPVRFGSVPVEKEPLGWDRRRGFRKFFPPVMLPFQVVDRITFGHPDLQPNRLFWGDNLHVMRQLPSESIDLIYIDPPFFSGRQYNVIFGDQNELRSFSDIWEGGMPGYLIWLNARLYEIKRLLKKTGSFYVHLDWHACHYVRIELDRVFGHDCFRNEIIWYYYNKFQGNINRFASNHDTVYWYLKTDRFTFYKQREEREQTVRQIKRMWDKEKGKIVNAKGADGKVQYIETNEKTVDDVWRISMLQPADRTERIGYPT